MKLGGFIGPSYVSQASIFAGERTINLYPETIETEAGKTRSALYPCPGLPDFATPPDSPGRGLFEVDGRFFGVFGTTFYEFDSAGVPTPLGTVAIDVNPATMCTNGNDEVLVTSATIGYLFNLGTLAFTSEATAVTFGAHLDTFFLGLDALTGTLKISEAGDGTTWDPTQVVMRSSAPDKWIAMLVSRKEIFLFGEKTGEVFYNAGNSPFPFAQRLGAFFEIGIEAPNSLTQFGSGMAWLGRSDKHSGTVYAMNGYSPIPISNHAIEWAIQQYKDAGTISDAIGWSYGRLGHTFYVLEFPTPGKTWVFDGTTNQWHERGKWNSGANDFEAYRPRFHAECFGKNLVCDGRAGKIYSLSETVYTDVGGSVLRRVRRTPTTCAEQRRLFFDYFEVEAERGVGLTAGTVLAPVQGSDPKLMLRYSNDGGQTWSNERTRSLGKKGEYGKRIRWDCCGSGRDRVWEVSSSDPVPVRLGDAYMGVS